MEEVNLTIPVLATIMRGYEDKELDEGALGNLPNYIKEIKYIHPIVMASGRVEGKEFYAKYPSYICFTESGHNFYLRVTVGDKKFLGRVVGDRKPSQAAIYPKEKEEPRSEERKDLLRELGVYWGTIIDGKRYYGLVQEGRCLMDSEIEGDSLSEMTQIFALLQPTIVSYRQAMMNLYESISPIPSVK